MSMETVAQTTREIKALQAKKKALNQGVSKSEKELKKTKQDVSNKQKSISVLENQLENRLRYIRELEGEMNRLDGQIRDMQQQVTRTAKELDVQKKRYARSLRMARAHRTADSPLLFVCSARSFPQMYRRARYAREYAAYQRMVGEQVVKKQNDLLDKQNQLLAAKSEKNKLMHEVMAQRMALHSQHTRQQQDMAGLKKKQKSIADKLAAQRKQLADLDKQIDRLVAYEVEQARKRAQEAARKAAEKKKAEQRKTLGKTTKGGAQKTPTPSASRAKEAPNQWLTAEDQRLNGTFERNKGRLPVPITGSYMLGGRFGVYNVQGLKGVQLDNKGTNYIGRPGARARAVFDGEVSAVFQTGDTKNVLIRHGSYITVYCNLSSVIVSRGQHVGARDLLGAVADDGSGNCVLHFQLRKGKVAQNPALWIGR